jgi:hypothetical protein
MMNPTDPREWWRENWQHSRSWGTCSRCGVKILLSHLDGGACRDRAGCDETQARKPEPVAMARAEDGSPVVAFAPAGLEVRPFGANDLDENGMPRGLLGSPPPAKVQR